MRGYHKARVAFFIAVFALTAHAEDLRVRLFSATPPVEIEIIPTQAALRTCATCKARQLDKPLKIVAAAHFIYYNDIRATAVLLDGRYRLRSNGVTTMELDAPLEARSANGTLRIVARIAMERYVAMALGAEAGGIQSPEALKAIAVAIRTYATRFRGRHQSEGFDVCDSTHCQVLRLADTSPAWRTAAQQTEGELLWFNGEPAYAYHHASCGGVLEDGRIMMGRSVPYLAEHPDNVCAAAGSDWDAQIDKADLRRALSAAGFHLRNENGVAVTERDRSGRARRLLVDGTPVDATSFRMALGRELGWNKVRSEMYAVVDEGGSVLFRGRGRGHGVGLCQTGAELRAEQGADYREILSFYYPGTTLGVTAQGLQWLRFAGERVELMTTTDRDRSLIASTELLLRQAEMRTGWKLGVTAQLRVYPTVASYRDSTGEPGWIAASTTGRVIRLQPAAVLRSKGTLDATIRHELLHMLVEERAKSGLPLWFREGVVLWLGAAHPAKNSPTGAHDLEERFRHPKSAEELRAAYAAAEANVSRFVKDYGERTVTGWVTNGLPAELVTPKPDYRTP